MTRLLLSLCALVSLPVAALGSTREMTPFALVVGQNDGGENMPALRYANRDAEKFVDVFKDLGNLSAERTWLLKDGQRDEVEAAMRQLDHSIGLAQRQGQRVMLLIYYSGHAKDSDLLLQDDRLPMQRIKQFLEESPAKIRIAFIDACQSGELTRMKGGQLAPSMVEVEQTQGHIIITSSSADEASQESDNIGGSFFTHYLVSGLRGDADQSDNGSVSLQEIYEYSYNRTVLRTASTRGGTQHPTYGFNLAGQGEIGLTQTLALRSGFSFSAKLAGDYLIYDLAKHRIAAELSKQAGRESFIAVPAGRYVIKKRRASDLLLGEVRISAGQKWNVQDSDLELTPFDADSTKGMVAIYHDRLKIAYSLRVGGESFFDAPSRNDLFYTAAQVSFQAEFFNLISRRLSLAIDLSLTGGNDDTRIVLDSGAEQVIPTTFNRYQLGVALYYHLDWDWFGLYAGPRLTLLMASREFGQQLGNYPSQSMGTLCPGVALGSVFHFGDWDLSIESRAHYLYYNIDDDASLGYGGFYFGVSYRH